MSILLKNLSAKVKSAFLLTLCLFSSCTPRFADISVSESCLQQTCAVLCICNVQCDKTKYDSTGHYHWHLACDIIKHVGSLRVTLSIILILVEVWMSLCHLLRMFWLISRLNKSFTSPVLLFTQSVVDCSSLFLFLKLFFLVFLSYLFKHFEVFAAFHSHSLSKQKII